MFDSVALNVVIGLIFIYLLYSLLATVLSEIIATKVGLRARNLKEAVDRMLNDEKPANFFLRLWDSLLILKNPDEGITKEFYDHPEIKYLGSSGIFSNPSAFKAISFSRTLLDLLFGNEPLTREHIDERLHEILTKAKGAPQLDTQTAEYINRLWMDSYGDVVKFKLNLEAWFDRTMEQATEWYKRKIQVVLLLLGFFIAWFFNADTFTIVHKLSHDTDARDKLVEMASAYAQNNKTIVDNAAIKDSAELRSYKQKLDSLLVVKREVESQIADANTLLGLGGWLPDSVQVHIDPKTHMRTYTPQIDAALLPASRNTATDKQWIAFSYGEKWCYFFGLFGAHFWGFLVTAIAISLGAPFWFDMLNNIMKLRTAPKVPTASPRNTVDQAAATTSPLNREA